ncbi:MAG: class I SAM-dependent methyltransferase [Chloroflexota bacterium]|nr:class I SAM-dependent methyltransferase [Chloroflexota bacterium]
MSKNDSLIDRYQAIKAQRNWRSWPIIRHWRAMRFRRLQPLGGGKAAGLSVIRYYWADFLHKQRADIRGHALEIGETTTIRQYGGSALVQADAIDLAAHSPNVRIVADLSRADAVPGDVYDCFVNQFTTCVIYDIEAALYHSIRLLKPGGVLLINFWCVDFYLHRGLDMGTAPQGHPPLYMHHWFTPIGVHTLLRGLALGERDYRLDIYGNLLTRMAFLLNLPANELTRQELNYVDPGQPLLICARVVKPTAWQAQKPLYREPLWTPSVSAAQVRPDTGHYGDEYQLKRVKMIL